MPRMNWSLVRNVDRVKLAVYLFIVASRPDNVLFTCLGSRRNYLTMDRNVAGSARAKKPVTPRLRLATKLIVPRYVEERNDANVVYVPWLALARA